MAFFAQLNKNTTDPSSPKQSGFIWDFKKNELLR